MNITYVANDGFLISAHGRKILIDAVFGGGSELTYAEVPSASALSRVMRAEPPFDGIDLITVSHFHDDHFHAPSIAECLKNNARAMFVAPPQATAGLAPYSRQIDHAGERVKAMLPEMHQRESLTVNSIHATALRTRHSPYLERDVTTGETVNRHATVENLAFVYDLEGERIFHSGDMDVLDADECSALGLDRERFSVAFIDRMICNARGLEILGRYFAGAVVVLMHIAPGERRACQSWVAENQQRLPMVVFQRPLDSLTL